MESGIGFGELALMYGDKRTASVLANTDCVTWVLDGATFKNIVIKSALQSKSISVELLEQFSQLKDVDIYEKTGYLEGISVGSYLQGQNIFKQQTQGEEFYMIFSVSFFSVDS